MYKDWKAKLESAYSFILEYSKITVWPNFDWPTETEPARARAILSLDKARCPPARIILNA